MKLEAVDSSLWRAIFESPHGTVIFALDTEYRYLAFTQTHRSTMMAIWGSEIGVGVNMLEVIRDDHDREKAKRNFDRALQGLHFIESEEYGDAGLCRTYYEDRYAPICDEAGLVTGLMVFVTDISERKLAEEALRESEARYRGLFQSSHDAIMTLEPPRWRFASGNPAAVKMFGVRDVAEFISLGPWELSPNQQADGQLSSKKAQEMIEMAMRDGSHFFEWTHCGRDGTEFLAMVLLSRVKLAEKVFLQATVRDITERRALETQLRQAQKMDTLGQLAGGVAHDFNNILAAMTMRLEFLADYPSLDRETKEELTGLMEDTKRATSLTRQLLIFSRQSVLDVKVLDLNGLVPNLLKMLGRLIGEHIAVQFHSMETQTKVEADQGMMEQVLMNLVVNARDAMPKGGRITIAIETFLSQAEKAGGNFQGQSGKFVCLSVADTGCGMDEATLKRIFEPFFTTKETGRGTGLGLATVHGIVTQHKGWVEVESEVGKGSTFKVMLPAITQEKMVPTETGKNAICGGHETILLVEDDGAVLRLMALSLRRLGYRVLEANHGQAAMQAWREQADKIDLLLSDMVMPGGLTGLDLAEQMRAEKPNLKVIIFSGYNEEMHGQSRRPDGSYVYLQKPYPNELLAKTIRDCLDGR
jgi:PAS domain S-box-containing protein